MATNPSDLDFKTDSTGVTYELRNVGIRTCQRIYDKEQLAAVKQTFKVLFKYADECMADRDAERALLVAKYTKEREEADADGADGTDGADAGSADAGSKEESE